MTIGDYTTLNDCKAAFPDNSLNATTTYNALCTTLITAYSRKFDKDTNRKPGAYNVTADVTRYPMLTDKVSLPIGSYDNRLGGGYGGGGKLWIGELAAAPTSVAVSLNGSITTYTTYTSTDYICGPYDALDDGHPYQWLELDFFNGTKALWSNFPLGNKITGKFGYAASTPTDVADAVIKMVIRGIRRAQQNYVDTGVLLDSAQIMQGSKLETDYLDVVAHYRKMPL